MANSRIMNTPAQAVSQKGTTHQQFTVAAVAGSLETLGSFTFSSDTKHVVIQVNGATVRYTVDGSTTATTTKGFRIDPGKEVYWPINWASRVSMISESGTATLELQETNYTG